MSVLRLTTREQKEFRAAQEALLSPLVGSASPREWQLRSNYAVRRFVGADHSVFCVPTRRDALPPAVTDDVDPTFRDRFYEHLAPSNDPYYHVDDPYVDSAVRRRVDGGADAYHLDQLLSREEQARSVMVQEVFVPFDLPRMTGLSYPLPEGEAAQFFGFKSPDAEGYQERGLKKLRLLVPAFAAGVRTFRRWINRRWEWISTLDRLTQPLALYDEAGSPIHRNTALKELLAGEPRSDRVTAVADMIAQVFAVRRRGPRRAQDGLSPVVERSVEGASITYRVFATYGPPEIAAGSSIVVQIESLGTPLPSPEDLQERFGLTPRQATVALLLAEGCSDKMIAKRLDISWYTARTHVRNILRRLDLSSRREIPMALLNIR